MGTTNRVSDRDILSTSILTDDMRGSYDGPFHQVDLNHRARDLYTSSAGAEVERSRLNNSCAPISSLPNEILAAVFEAGHKSSVSNYSQPSFGSLVTQVTERWRNVALSTPLLWTHIRIAFFTNSTTSIAKAEAYLSRSGALPLDLFLEVAEHDEDGEDEFLDVLDVLGCHAARWRSLWVDSEASRYGIRDLLALLPVTAPRLQRVQISMEPHEYYEPGENSTQHIFSGGAPLLTTVRIRGLGLHLCLPPVGVTTLELHTPMYEMRIEPARLASLLASLSSLITLVINGDFVVGGPTPKIIVTMPSLRHFHLLTISYDQMPWLLKMISAPQLHTLLLENVIALDIDDFGWTSGPSQYPELRSLTILTEYNDSFGPVPFMNVIRTFPKVKHFTLANGHLDDFLTAVLDYFSIYAWPGWPDLHTMTLINRSQHSVPDLLIKTVSERFCSGHPIRMLRLSPSLITALLESDDFERLVAQVNVEETILYSETDSFADRWPNEND